MHLKSIKISVVMQEQIAFFNAESGDKAIDGRAHRKSEPSQKSVVDSRGVSQCQAGDLEDLKSRKVSC